MQDVVGFPGCGVSFLMCDNVRVSSRIENNSLKLSRQKDSKATRRRSGSNARIGTAGIFSDFIVATLGLTDSERNAVLCRWQNKNFG
jgi:hypothetical protein